MPRERHFKLGIEETARGTSILVYPHGEDPRYYEGTGFFELFGRGRAPRDAGEVFRQLQNVLPSDGRGQRLMLDTELKARLAQVISEAELSQEDFDPLLLASLLTQLARV